MSTYYIYQLHKDSRIKAIECDEGIDEAHTLISQVEGVPLPLPFNIFPFNTSSKEEAISLGVIYGKVNRPTELLIDIISDALER